MKKIRIVFAALFVIVLAPLTEAEQVPNSQAPKTTNSRTIPQRKRIELAKKSESGKRPKAPSRQVIGCEYTGENLILDFVYPEGICSVIVTDHYSGNQQSYTVDTSVCYVEIAVGELYPSTLTLTTQDDVIYSCELM